MQYQKALQIPYVYVTEYRTVPDGTAVILPWHASRYLTVYKYQIPCSTRREQYRHVLGGRVDTCDHGLSRSSLRVKPPTSKSWKVNVMLKKKNKKKLMYRVLSHNGSGYQFIAVSL